MSASDEQGYSLADQAAAWVPPWLREQPVEVVEAPPGPELPAAADPATDPVRLRAEGPHPSAVAEETDIREKAAAEPSPPAPLEPATVVPHQADSSSFPTVVAPVARTAPVSAALPMLALVDDDELRAALEAILLVVDQPVTAA
ncbi:MAG TPA: hypothetical protein VFX60_00040, partial [Micromonospora sp.]|nr:hypothetical protein [Micromonospora sp.]